MKLQSNGVRTAIIHALMHTRGVIARPWRQDLKLGAQETKDGLALVFSAEKPYEGELVFDIPRHRIYMGFTKDWPRMNTIPEWFVVEPEAEYVVEDVESGSTSSHSGEDLHEGLPVKLESGREILLRVRPE
jgi:hypothetical protein